MSASEEFVPAESVHADSPSDPTNDAPPHSRLEDEPDAEPEAETSAPPAAEQKPSESKHPTKPTSSPAKKVARSAKPRSMQGRGKVAHSELRNFKPGDIVLSRLKGYPPWRESS